MRTLSFVAGLVIMAGCETTPGESECTTSAHAVTYEPAATLASANVQDALDELAARPIPERPLAQRMYRRETGSFTSAAGPYSLELPCDEPGHLALSGSCLMNSDNDSVPPPRLVSNGRTDIESTWRCEWTIPSDLAPGNADFALHLVCLDLEP